MAERAAAKTAAAAKAARAAVAAKEAAAAKAEGEKVAAASKALAKRLSAHMKRNVRSHGLSAPSAVPQLGICTPSGRAWWLWAARSSQEEADPLGAQPLR